MDEQLSETLVEVSREHFFAVVGPMDVHPNPRGAWPYNSVWLNRSLDLVGRSEDSAEYPCVRRFYLRRSYISSPAPGAEREAK